MGLVYASFRKKKVSIVFFFFGWVIILTLFFIFMNKDYLIRLGVFFYIFSEAITDFLNHLNI